MANLRIATRYAKSVLDLAKEQGKLDAVFADMQMLKKACENKDLSLLLRSPIISADKKNKVLDALFTGKVDVLTSTYLRLLTEKGRESNLPEIALAFILQYNKGNGITPVKITSAAPLSEAVLNSIKTKLLASSTTAETLEITVEIDKELIGGFVVEFEDKRYDTSVKKKLKDLKAEFADNLYIKAI